MVKKGKPVVKIAASETHGVGGIECCCWRCCTCIHIEFLKTLPGTIKFIEAVSSFVVQGLLINYGLNYHAQIGPAFEGALTTSAACFLNSAVLLFCYMFSEKSYKIMQSSHFEMMFNTIACFFCLSSSSYLGFATKMFLWPLFIVTPGFNVFPAMTAAYYLMGVSGFVYGFDAFLAFRNYKS